MASYINRGNVKFEGHVDGLPVVNVTPVFTCNIPLQPVGADPSSPRIVVMTGKAAEQAARLRRGQHVYVEGDDIERTWTDDAGDHTAAEVAVRCFTVSQCKCAR